MLIKNRYEVLIDTIRAAGKTVKSAVPSDGILEKDGRANFVTAADLASEKIIMDSIRKYFPNDTILSEETESSIANLLDEDHLWVIDPIDGTNNFRYERNYSAVSVGYVERGIVQAGAVYNPFRDELFHAERGKGAYINDKRIMTGDLSDLSKAVVSTDNSYDPQGTRHVVELFLKINPSPWLLVRGSAVLAMCDVAAGRIDLYFHIASKPWDNAAAFLIAEEAGVAIHNIKGNVTNFLSESVVMGNASLVKQFFNYIGN
jgi:myo-inositol-1(or 4)-monophosphatase